ncbi:carbamoyl transferase [Alphaproteobacteria bacterium]|nr:carbamoyl transferase [Alphaproteobacteria bacterium]
MTNILSINPIGHDTSASLMMSSMIVAACEQERYSGDKHSRLFPIDAVNDCLKIGNININQVDMICVPWMPELMIRDFYLRPALLNDARLKFLRNDYNRIEELFSIEEKIRFKLKYKGPVKFLNHHQCHLASTYYSSGFHDPLIVSYDGCGEIDTMAIGVIENGKIVTKVTDNQYPNSLGLLYSAITNFLGWKYACDEGIVMGLASMGNANAKIPQSELTYIDVFRKAVIQKKDFKFELDMPSFLNFFEERDVWVGKEFFKLMGPKRDQDDKITKNHTNIAAGLQLRIEEIILNHLRLARKTFNKKTLCVSGGVGLNCTLNGKISSEKIFDEIFVVPAAGDTGLTIGACYLANPNNKIQTRNNFYLGSRFEKDEILSELSKSKLDFEEPSNLFEVTAKHLFEGKIVAWFQGATEFGPRALGNRSILTKPFPLEMKNYVNKQVKFRESFRPFAPAILEEFKDLYFYMDQISPHMLMAFKAKEQNKKFIAATVHDDNSSRVQTVSKENNSRFYSLLKSFYKLSKVPVLLNTSFNIKGQPIVNTPKEAIETFLNTKIDVLVIGDYILSK